ncbi:MAG: gfo/Idh/MocA family oxidoreductase [Glaciihabitans sp.]|nr:gfo/Idh/MocA family oxidoreductase [Glaciihabitans sp.]
MIPRVAIIGVGGHGRSHVERANAMARSGRIDFVAAADPSVAAHLEHLPGVAAFEDAEVMLAESTPDIVIVSTPIHTHFPLAAAALNAGANVLLEKPPTATMEEFHALVATANDTGRLVQVGFQSLGSSAIGELHSRIAAGRIGKVVGYSASAGWVRPRSYWERAAWAGKRRANGRVVADGVLTNPLAHASATALAVAGATGAEDIVALDLDLHRANTIEADDTSVARFTLADGLSLTTAVSLCAAEREEPWISVDGTDGRLVFYYALDIVQEFHTGRAPFTTRHDRVELLDNLLSALDGGELCAPLSELGGFMRLLDGVMAAPEPHRIDPSFITPVNDERGEHLVIAGVEEALRMAVSEQATFRELDLEWAR